VRLKLRKGWRNDESTLIQYFNACIQNWKGYKGPRTQEQLNRLYGIYKQATVGDCDEPEPENPKGHAGIKWTEWHRLRGMSQNMAKRRFITFLASIDPAIIDVMPSEKPPDG
jgi:acyl-CoA-binding protein